MAKIFSYVILFPLALLALGAKAIYKELYLKPRFNALQQHEIFDIRELHFSTDAMRTIIEELPHWFVGHFTNDKGYCQGIYQLLYCDTQNKSEEEIKELFSKLSNEFVEMLSHAFEKNGITLPRLQLPKNNKTLERGVQWIIHSAWRKTIQMLLDELSRNPKNNLNSFYQLSNAIGDRGIATHDSWNIFQSQLSQRTPEEQEKLKKLIGTPTLCDKRKMTIMGPSFTISIANS